MSAQAEHNRFRTDLRPTLGEEEIAAIRVQYPIVDKCVFWDCAAVSPISRNVSEAMARQTGLHCADIKDAVNAAVPVQQMGRELAAKLVSSTPDRVAYIQNTSHGMSLVALGLDWLEGDNVVVAELEFPSNYLIWESLAANGVEVRKLKARNGALLAEDLRALTDSRTRVVAVSQVQFYSGFRVDLAAFADVCSHHDALLVVDGTQSVGVLDLDMATDGVDVVVVSAHKWLLGPLGIGFMAFSQRAFERVCPRVVGWLSVSEPFSFHRKLDFLPDARRFEPGTENAAGIFGLSKRLEEIQSTGAKRIESYVLSLGEQIRQGARRIGFEIVSDWPQSSLSGIVLMRSSKVQTDVLFDRLYEARVRCSVRNGAIRFSPHYFSDTTEVAQVLEVLRSA
ncbi:MAG: aminotransferase class V-fold PLP-dependent enzyme [Mesorhizobium sp.]|uniref:aminotransferase class V-fold PLP-dependent enzyme n=2 Tax=Mesorhizobium TaxID=68287 RepID=UPI000FE59822|nr:MULTISPECIES: aminotransferase class V-fold PLP-dependent enzyme [unclassified Mesorhizobium]RWE36048.1 MAG: aminotransferase class V-fold PLP-dependent enzyme [Mesorhizobium sp.]TGP87881.1 aminotransferase class V-fold PLP-dependent enzyme [Mesorhizobium sp. M8A.F.Ca.ET.218.01.1.1]TGT15679.1 aminotransferase class V-fold PLP-dependent enzyme [Mesorhizobium sp. M8A.F.Ca.ET.213.01.1.1]